MASIYCSVIIPFWNEEGSLEKLWRELEPVMEKINKPYEVLFVDDGSGDKSFEIAKKISKENKSVKVIHFSRNQGKAAVLQAGFKVAKGDYVVTMDADLQDDPKEIPALLKKIQTGYDLISGWKKERHDPWHKTIPSYILNNLLLRAVSGLKIHDINCGLKIYRNEVVKSVSVYGELYRFIPILAANKGFKVGEMVVKHRERKYGKSKYGISRFIRGFLDVFTIFLLTKFLKRPLHLFGPIGLFLFLAGFVILIYLSCLHFFGGQSIGERPLLIFGVMFVIAGLQLVFTGLIAELITYYAQTRTNTDN